MYIMFFLLNPNPPQQNNNKTQCHGQKSRFIGDKLIPPLKNRKQRCAASRFACFSFLLISFFFKEIYLFFLEI